MQIFYKPEDMISEDEDDISFVGNIDIPIELIEEESFSENDDNPADEDFDPNNTASPVVFTDDSDYNDDDSDNNAGETAGDTGGGGGSSSRIESSIPEPRHDIPIDEDEDDVIKAIVAATKAPRTHPPDISTEDFVIDLSFHPDEDILAAGTITGDILIYKYSNEENTLLDTLEVHNKSIRTIEFGLDGQTIYSSSRDKSILLTDTETGKFKRNYENAHDAPVYRMNVFSENLFATGDDDGTVKLWDVRDKNSNPIFSLKEVDDFISAIQTNSAQKLLLTTSGDGLLTAINIGMRKMFVQSEPYDEELTCMGLFRNESKLVVGTSKGRLYTFDWNAFGLHSNMFPGPKSHLSLLLPITERIAIVAGEEGILRAMHVVPGRNLGVVGQHSLGVEAMDISTTGEFVASSSHDNDIKFWNIKYFEDFDDIKYNEKQNARREQSHNLPSSKYTNPGDFFADLV